MAIDHAALGGSWGRVGVGGRHEELGHGLDLRVALHQLPRVVCSKSTAPIRRMIEASWKDADHVGPAFDLLVEALQGGVLGSLVRCWVGKVM